MSEFEEVKTENEVSVGRYIARLPGINWVASNNDDNGWWWVKFSLNLNNKASWHIVQGLGYVFNNLALNDPLPTVFFPTSPPPDMNSGPHESLCWVVEPRNNEVDPSVILSALYGNLLFDVEDEDEWIAWSARAEET